MNEKMKDLEDVCLKKFGMLLNAEQRTWYIRQYGKGLRMTLGLIHEDDIEEFVRRADTDRHEIVEDLDERDRLRWR